MMLRLPMPRFPFELLPQQTTFPLLRIAQLCATPVAHATGYRPEGNTTGNKLLPMSVAEPPTLAVLPIPTWP
jgi:hypothetical protein